MASMSRGAMPKSVSNIVMGAWLAAACIGCSSANGVAQSPDTRHQDLPRGGNLVKKPHFADGRSLPWTSSFTRPASGEAFVKDGALCLRIDDAGKNPWDAQLRHREMTIQNEHYYTIQFRAWADRDTTVRAKVGMSGPPYAEYWWEKLALTVEPQTFDAQFGMFQSDDPTAEFAFHVGGELAAATPLTVCIDQIYLVDPEFVPPADTEVVSLSPIRVNQVGYFPNLTKHATVVSDATEPLEWSLLDGSGAPAASGKTRPIGRDVESQVRYRPRHLPEAQVRRARVLLSQPQRHPDRDALRG